MKKAVSILVSIAIIAASVITCIVLLKNTDHSPVIEAELVDLTADAGYTGSTEQWIDPAKNEHSIAGKYDHDAYLRQIGEIADKYGAVGVSVALIDNGKVIDTFACGSASKDGREMTDMTKIRVASISKVLIGIATMISVENGTMSLDEDIGTYWGFDIGTHASGDVITPRSLLTHTSSVLVSESTANMYYNAMAERLRTGSGIGNWRSGNISNHNYNNYAMDVLGMTVELANHKTLDDILRERIYDKLGIDASFYGGDVKDTSQIADLYYTGGSESLSAEKQKTWHSGAPGSIGWGFAGGVTINVRDLGKIFAMLANRGVYGGVRYLSEESVQNLEYHEGNKTGEYWQCQPLRYEPDKYGQGEFYYHTGSAYGVLSLAGYNPDSGRGVVILTTAATRKYDDDIFDVIAKLLLTIDA